VLPDSSEKLRCAIYYVLNNSLSNGLQQLKQLRHSGNNLHLQLITYFLDFRQFLILHGSVTL